MAEKRKKRKDKKNDGPEPTKEEKSVATYLRFNCPTKKTVCAGEEVHYFTASNAIDLLLESKWSSSKAKSSPLFTNRNSCVSYCQTLFEKGMFWRARKLVPKQKERSKTEKSSKTTEKEPKKESKESEALETAQKSPKKRKDAKTTDEQPSVAGKSDKKEEPEKKPKPKKIKLEFHSEQVFRDGNDVYVWHFDPTSWKKFLLGLAIVVGSIAVCLFPLWPPWMRLGIYYASLVAMGFVGLLMALIVFRSIIFGIVWVCSWGRHQLWILPNLTEDCGFFESFKPTYSYHYEAPKTKEQKEADAAKKQAEKEKISGDEDENGKNDTDTDRSTEPEAADNQRDEVNNSASEQEGTPKSHKKTSKQKTAPTVRQRKLRSSAADAEIQQDDDSAEYEMVPNQHDKED